MGRRRADLLAHVAGTVLKIETGLGVHRQAGMVLGDGGGQDGPLGRGRTFLEAEAAVHAALRIDHQGLLRENQMEAAVVPGIAGNLGLGVECDPGLLKEGPQAFLHQAGAALLANIGGLAAQMRRPAPEKGGFLHQGHFVPEARQLQGGADPGDPAA
jgi:hypothetical protein